MMKSVSIFYIFFSNLVFIKLRKFLKRFICRFDISKNLYNNRIEDTFVQFNWILRLHFIYSRLIWGVLVNDTNKIDFWLMQKGFFILTMSLFTEWRRMEINLNIINISLNLEIRIYNSKNLERTLKGT
jgi:hypothetical protein